jgi:glucosamine--fructose-6-phosphate aminotransferase (isomerizing)
MCGIIAIVRRSASRPIPAPGDLLGPVEAAAFALASADVTSLDVLEQVAVDLEQANRLAVGLPGVVVLLNSAGLAASLADHLGAITMLVQSLERRLDAPGAVDPARLEAINGLVVRIKDAAWSLQRDRLRTARAVADLAGPGPTQAGLAAYLSVQQALSAIDRLEVRGRDSAGLHLLVSSPALGVDSPGARLELEQRGADGLFRSGSVRRGDGWLSFVYKAAAEIGELGDNTAALRTAIREDELLRRALASDDVDVVVLGHTRWASVGIVSEANAHPLNGEQVGREPGPYVVGVLNGDVDNYADLIATEGLKIAPEITTDAKVIPTLMSAYLLRDPRSIDAFRHTVASFEGSVAIAASTIGAPNRLQLALRGSGQALYVGIADDTYIVASEPYGVVEETARYLRMDGETPGNLDSPNASRGQIIELDGDLAGTLEGITRAAYDGTVLPIDPDELATAQITTRDIDRGEFPHFLLKEITEAPASFRKTLRGKLVDIDGVLSVALGPETLPTRVRERLAAGLIRDIVVIGQGTAAVAGHAMAAFLTEEFQGSDIRVSSTPATELSGFGLRADMSDTLIVAISQSGTTTDTNRTVDLVRSRGASVIAIVNRRNSDLTDKADGVLYTSDGRDVEMSVASTKAFYAQVAAGALLSVALADAAGAPGSSDRQPLLQGLRSLPDAMETTLGRRPLIAAATQHAPSRRYWAVVGNGPNFVAAMELRIKLSELCYKSIACDRTEDKKHIDLSSEPMILVCAAGLVGSNADDVAKEVAIYRAHKAAPIVIANEGETRFNAALDAITVPAVHPRLAFVLSTVVGHLFGYEVARAIDAQALPLRELRAAIEQAMATSPDADGDALLRTVRSSVDRTATQFFDALRAGSLNGNLEAATATRLAIMLRYALGSGSLDTYQLDFGKIGTPSVVLDDLLAALTLGIEELTRPVDAIKHQAKTVTVGISRSDETLLQAPLPRAVLDAGAPRDRLSYKTLRTLADLDPAVTEVLGFTRYRVEGMGADDTAAETAVIVDRGGISAGIPSRTDRDPRLRGTKHRVATEREVLVSVGFDGRTLVLVPEVKDGVTTGLLLLFVRFHPRLGASSMRGVLRGYRNRYAELRDLVTETEPTFREDLLESVDVVDLLVKPVNELARAWRG